MIVVEDLQAFVSSDAEVAERALGKMAPQVRRFVMSHLKPFGIGDDDRQDLAQRTVVKLWAVRETIEVRSLGEWWRLVKRISERLAQDWFRRRGATPTVPDEVLADIPDAEIPYVSAFAAAAIERDAIFRAADDCWLGARGDEREAQAVALALLVLVDGVPFDEACVLLGVDSGEARQRIGQRAAERAVLLRAAYAALYWDNEALVREMLGEPKQTAVARAACGNEGSPKGWTPEEAGALALRYGNGLTSDQIQRFGWCRRDADALDGFFASVSDRLPFVPIARRLVGGAKRVRQAAALAESGLWKRLVFQYCFVDQIPQRQILERTEPSATVAGAKLTAAMLNGWIGNDRLTTQIARHLEEKAR
jgi:DNA-directed RNA polymerase specialized sigma24 family protein